MNVKNYLKEIVAKKIDQSRAHIERYGWYQGNMMGPNEETCSAGAICHYTGGNLYTHEATLAVDALLEAIGVDYDDMHLVPGQTDPRKITLLTTWNDAEERTQQEVLDTFAKAEKIVLAGFDPDA